MFKLLKQGNMFATIILLMLHFLDHLLPLTKTTHKDDLIKVGKYPGAQRLTIQGGGRGGGNQFTNTRGKITVCTAVTPRSTILASLYIVPLAVSKNNTLQLTLWGR